MSDGSVLVRLGEGLFLLGARLFLMLRFPLIIRHAVHDLARLRVCQRLAGLLRRLAIPARQAIAAEAGQIHHVDVLHIRPLAQMLDQAAEGGGFEFRAGLVVHASLVHLGPHSKVRVSANSWSTTWRRA